MDRTNTKRSVPHQETEQERKKKRSNLSNDQLFSQELLIRLIRENDFLKNSNETLKNRNEILEKQIEKRTESVFENQQNSSPVQDSAQLVHNFIVEKLNELNEQYDESSEKNTFIEKSKQLLKKMADVVLKNIERSESMRQILFYGKVQGKKTMWRNFYVELYCLLNEKIKCVVLMSWNNKDNCFQDIDRTVQALGNQNYCHNHLNVFFSVSGSGNLKIRDLNTEKIVVVYSIGNNHNINKLNNILDGINPEEALLVLDESDTFVKGAKKEFTKAINSTNFLDKFRHIIRLTATPVKDLFSDQGIEEVLEIPKTPDYQGFEECEKFDDINVLDEIEFVKKNYQNKDVYMGKVNKDVKDRLIKELNTHVVFEIENNELLVYYKNQKESLIEYQQYFSKKNKNEVLKIDLEGKNIQELFQIISATLGKQIIYITSKSQKLDFENIQFETIPILGKENVNRIVDDIKDRIQKQQYCGTIVNIEKDIIKHSSILEEIMKSDNFREIQNQTLLTCYNKDALQIFTDNLPTSKIEKLGRIGKIKENVLEIKMDRQHTISEILHQFKIIFPEHCFILVGCCKLSRGLSFCSKKVNGDKSSLCVKTVFCFYKNTHEVGFQILRNLGECRPDIKPRIYCTREFMEGMKKRNDAIETYIKSNRQEPLRYDTGVRLSFTNPDMEKTIKDSVNVVQYHSLEVENNYQLRHNRQIILGTYETKDIWITESEYEKWPKDISDDNKTITFYLNKFPKRFQVLQPAFDVLSNMKYDLIPSNQCDINWVFKKKSQVSKSLKFEEIPSPSDEDDVVQLTENTMSFCFPSISFENMNAEKKRKEETKVCNSLKREIKKKHTIEKKFNLNIAWDIARLKNLNSLNYRVGTETNKPLYIAQRIDDQSFQLVKYKEAWEYLLHDENNTIFKCHFLGQSGFKYWKKVTQ